jgi:thiol-disulfide isomerase/thioredoxin
MRNKIMNDDNSTPTKRLSDKVSIKSHPSIKVCLTLSLSCLFAILAANAASPIPDPARKAIDSSNWKAAIPALEGYLRTEPASAEGHYLLGEALAKSKKYTAAKPELKKALRLGAGGEFTLAANKLLLELPKDVVAPKQKFANARIKGRRVAAAGFAHPRILSFTAAWAEPCKQLKTDLDKVQGQYGTQLDVSSIDVDDPKNEKLMEQYDVSPIPTVVFLDSDGKVVNYFVGYSNNDDLDSSVKKVLNKG